MKFADHFDTRYFQHWRSKKLCRCRHRRLQKVIVIYADNIFSFLPKWRVNYSNFLIKKKEHLYNLISIQNNAYEFRFIFISFYIHVVMENENCLCLGDLELLLMSRLLSNGRHMSKLFDELNSLPFPLLFLNILFE